MIDKRARGDRPLRRRRRRGRAPSRFAAEHDLPLAVRGGGHNVAGTAVVDDGLVIDLSAMRGVRSTPRARTVHVQGGATWADVDRVTAPLGLATPGGVVSETGVAGLALSGGVSAPAPPRRDDRRQPRLRRGGARRRPPACARAPASTPTCTGRCAAAAATSASSRRSSSRLHALGPEVFRLHVAYPLEDAARVLAGWRDAVAGAPDELSTAGLIWSLPVIAELPEELRGMPYVGVAGMWAGDPEEGERVTRALRELADAAARHERRHRLRRLPALARPVLPRGLRAATGRRSTWTGCPTRRSTRPTEWSERRPSDEHAGDHPPLRRRDRARAAPRRPRSATAARSGC